MRKPCNPEHHTEAGLDEEVVDGDGLALLIAVAVVWYYFGSRINVSLVGGKNGQGRNWQSKRK